METLLKPRYRVAQVEATVEVEAVYDDQPKLIPVRVRAVRIINPATRFVIVQYYVYAPRRYGGRWAEYIPHENAQLSLATQVLDNRLTRHASDIRG